jgi:FkbM family methyltransferase
MIKQFIKTLIPPSVRRIVKPLLYYPPAIIYSFLNRFFLWYDGISICNIVTESWSPFFDDHLLFEKKLGKSFIDLQQTLLTELDQESKNTVADYLERVTFASYAARMSVYCSSKQWKQVLHDHERNKKYEVHQLMCQDRIKHIYPTGLDYLPQYVVDDAKSKDAIDCGAYIGDTALAFVRKGVNKVICFEPVKNNFILLQKNIKLITKGTSASIVPVPKGVGSKKENLSITGSDSGAIIRHSTNQPVEITDIDSFVKENNCNVGIIKMDVEGFEWNIIQGALDTIKRNRPILLISIYHNPHDFFTIKPFLKSLNLGYKFLVRKIAPDVPYAEVNLICYAENINHFNEK